MKNIKGILSLTLVIIFLVGCSSTETMTANEFKKSMEKKGFTVVDQTASAADSTYQKIYVAVDENDVCRGYAFCQLQEQPFSNNMVPFGLALR